MKRELLRCFQERVSLKRQDRSELAERREKNAELGERVSTGFRGEATEVEHRVLYSRKGWVLSFESSSEVGDGTLVDSLLY